MPADVKQPAYLTLDGIMGYETQIAGVTDKDPHQKVKSTMVRQLKNKSKKKVAHKRQAIAHAVEKVMKQK